MIPDDIVRMLAKGPGQYVIGLDPMCTRYFRVEVDEQGLIHQLTPDLKRDGLLSNDGWLSQVKVYVERVRDGVTEFVRIAHPEMPT